MIVKKIGFIKLGPDSLHIKSNNEEPAEFIVSKPLVVSNTMNLTGITNSIIAAAT